MWRSRNQKHLAAVLLTMMIILNWLTLTCSVPSPGWCTSWPPPSTLNCGHTFCQDCNMKWRKQTKLCPICRTRIKQMTSSTALDQFFTKMFGLMDQKRMEFARKRKEKALSGTKKKK